METRRGRSFADDQWPCACVCVCFVCVHPTPDPPTHSLKRNGTSRVRLIIKQHVDNQVEDANYHINQYLSKNLIVTLGMLTLGRGGMERTSAACLS